MRRFSCAHRLLASAAGRSCTPETSRQRNEIQAPPDLYPGVRRAGVLLRPVRRPPQAGVKVHIVSGFHSVRLRAVVGLGRVADEVLQVLVVVAVGLLQVHSVRVVVPPTWLLRVIYGLRGKHSVVVNRRMIKASVN